MYKNIGKTFLILPFVGYHYFAQLYAGPNDWTVTVLLRGVVFGSVSDTDFTSVVIIIEHLLYLLLFHLLFGTFISRHFMYMPAYFFSRVYGRQRWLLRQSLYLFFYGLWYVFLFLGGHLIGCIWKSAWEPDAETYRTFWIMYAACASLLLFTTFLINFGIVLWKTGVGFAGCWIFLILLSMFASKTYRNGVATFLNPMSYGNLFAMPTSYVVAKMAYQFLLSAALVLAACRYLKTYDITLREVD